MRKKMKRYVALLVSIVLLIANTAGVQASNVANDSKNVLVDSSKVYSSNSLLENKQVLASFLPEIQELDEGVDYAKRQLVFLTDSKEEANQIADSYHARLISYEYGVGVLLLGQEQSVVDTLIMSANPYNQLPVLWPNYVSRPAGNKVSDNNIVVDPYMDKDVENAYDYFQWHHDIVGSTYAWNAGYMGQDVDVAVLDTGVLTHNDLKLTSAKAFLEAHSDAYPEEYTEDDQEDPQVSSNDVSDNDVSDNDVSDNDVSDNDVKDPTQDVYGHGTHVAGIIGAKLNGKMGAGIAPNVNLHNIKIIGDNGYGLDSDIMAGINYASRVLEVDVINMSLRTTEYNALYEDVVQEAISEGTVFVVAAGNENNESKCYPAAFKNVICVAATTKTNARADYSNFGSWVDVAAPGSEISASYMLSENNYMRLSGTSMATPVVAGEVAVLLSAKDKFPELNDKQGKDLVLAVEKILKKGVIPARGTKIGTGIPTLPKLLNIKTVGETPNVPVLSLKSGIYNIPSIDVSVKADKGTRIYYSLDGKAPTYKEGKLSPNAIPYKGVISIEGAKKVTLNAIAINRNQLASKAVTATYHLKPMISSVSLNGYDRLVAGNIMKVKASITPSYAANQVLKYSVAPAKKGVTIDQTGLLKSAKTAVSGNYVVSVATTDGSNIVTSKTIQVVKAAIIRSIGFQSTTYQETRKETNLEKDFAKELKITYRSGGPISGNDMIWESSNEKVATIDKSGKVTIAGPGTTTIKATTKDGSQKTASTKLIIKQAVTSIDFVIDNEGGNLYYMAPGTSKKINVTINKNAPKATNEKVEYSVFPENQGLSISKDGVLKATSNIVKQDYTITVTAQDKSAVENNVSVFLLPNKAKALTLSGNSVNLSRVRPGTNLGMNVYPAYMSSNKYIEVNLVGSTAETYSAIKIINHNENLVEIETNQILNGKYVFNVRSTGNGTGTAKITVQTTDGSNLKKTISVKVVNPVSNIVVSEEGGRSSYLAAGTTCQLVATVHEDYGPVDTKKVEWYSTNPNVMSVDQKGVVTSKSKTEGALIVARAMDGSQVEDMFYLNGTLPIKNFSFKTLDYKMPMTYIPLGFKRVGGYPLDYPTFEYQYGKVNPLDEQGSAYHAIDWYISDPDMVAVQFNFVTGYVIVPLKKGRCSITAKTMDGTKLSKTYQLFIY